MIPRLKSIYDLDTLETDRLFLKPLSNEFACKEYVNWLNDKKVNKYLESGGDYTLKSLKHYLGDVENKPKYFWAITLKSNSKHIGNIKIDPIHQLNRYGEYGILIGDRESWGKGFAQESSEAVLKYCFEKLKLNKINLGVSAKNHKAIKLYQKLGFETEGHYKNHILLDGDFLDSYRMAIFNKNEK